MSMTTILTGNTTGNTTGNRCGHDPRLMREYKRPTRHPIGFIRGAMSRCAEFFWFPTKYLMRLQNIGSDAQQRAERREAIAATLQVLINYCDLESLQVGTPFKDKPGLNFLRTKYIAKLTGFGEKRIMRALADLEAAHYITIKRRVITHHDGGFSQANEISITQRCFLDLQMENITLHVSRHYKRNSLMRQGKISKPVRAAAAVIAHAAMSPALEKEAKKVRSFGDCLKFLKKVEAAT